MTPEKSADLFSETNYRSYLSKRLDLSRGARAALCRLMKCQNAYLSHVLHERAHLSLEQAHVVCRFFDHSKQETQYFLLLVQAARAGTAELKRHFEDQLTQIRSERLALKNRLENLTDLSGEVKATYYSHWYFGAVHILLMIPELRTPQALSRRLQLPLTKIQAILEFLSRSGLVEVRNNEYHSRNVWMHLEHDSPWIAGHHQSFRQHASQSLDHGNPEEDLHFSTIYTLSKKDFFAIREQIAAFLENVDNTVRPSAEEDAFVMNIDWYRL